MKTIVKVLEVMLSKPATPTWTMSPTPPNFGPTEIWGWGGGNSPEPLI